MRLRKMSKFVFVDKKVFEKEAKVEFSSRTN